MQLNLDGEGTLTLQIDRAIRSLIERGALARGERLPSSRSLASELGVSRNTVLAALHNLEIEGYVEPRRGSGTYVRFSAAPRPAVSVAQRATTPTNRISVRDPAGAGQTYDFRYGQVEWPAATDLSWRRSVAAACRRPLAESRLPLAGCLELRRAMCRHLAVQRSLDCDPENMIVTSGTRETLALTGSMCLAPGRRAVLESPGYPLFAEFVHAHGAQDDRVPVDVDGLVTGLLPPDGADLAIVTPAHQFPTGRVLSFERRRALTDWARATDTVVFEDDYDGEFRYGARPVAPVRSPASSDIVVYSTSFSKTLSPRLRLGFGLFPQRFMETVLTAKRRLFGSTSQLVQLAAVRFLESGDYRRHLKRVGRRYESKRRELIRRLQDFRSVVPFVPPPAAGAHVSLPLPAGCSVFGLVDHLRRNGVLVSGTYDEPSSTGVQAFLILGFGGIELGAIPSGIERLIGLLEERGK